MHRAPHVMASVQGKPNRGMEIIQDIKPWGLKPVMLKNGAEVVPLEPGARDYLQQPSNLRRSL